LILRVGHQFYSPKIARLLAEWKEVEVYSIAYEFSEGSLPVGPFFSTSSSCKSQESGPVSEKAVYHLRLAHQTR
jgi:hypothetical protein